MEAQAFLQAQLSEIEVEGRGASLRQVPRQGDGRRCKGGLAPSRPGEEEGSISRACRAKEPLELGANRAIQPRGQGVCLLCVEGGLAQLSG